MRPPQWTPENAGRFRDPSVVAAYHLRLPYPPDVFATLTTLVEDGPNSVLDVGTGTGEIARPLAATVGRVVAVDTSPAMIERGRSLPGGDHPHLEWVVSRAEDFQSDDVFDLITTGDSLHWMDWEVVLPRFSQLLAPDGVLAIVHRTDLVPQWQTELASLIATYSTSRFYETFDLIAELERRQLFRVTGRYGTDPQAGWQSVEDYIESFHSRSSLSRDHMEPAAADAFDTRLRQLVTPWSSAGNLHLQTIGEIVWGIPLPGNEVIEPEIRET